MLSPSFICTLWREIRQEISNINKVNQHMCPIELSLGFCSRKCVNSIIWLFADIFEVTGYSWNGSYIFLQMFSKERLTLDQSIQGKLHFFQFHAIFGKEMAKIIYLCLHTLGWRFLSGKSWIRHCKGIDQLDQEERQVFNLPGIGSLNFRYSRLLFSRYLSWRGEELKQLVFYW